MQWATVSSQLHTSRIVELVNLKSPVRPTPDLHKLRSVPLELFDIRTHDTGH